MARKRRAHKAESPRTRKRRYGPAEIFVALIGLGFLVFVIGFVISLVVN